ncbi:hypothetical protein [Methanobrevibacter sp.]|uniref:hypothetical protein n=1 Tax=Methanobrevibacter sp. TaxID=66852 RepID=UPI00386DE287
MKTCPNCFKNLTDSFSYCNECGSRLDGQNTGDFTTDFLNVFHVGGSFIYLFAVRGRQIVLEADTIEELRQLVGMNRFPWLEKKRSLLNPEVSLTEKSSDECAIIGVSTLTRNPQYSNLDRLFK